MTALTRFFETYALLSLEKQDKFGFLVGDLFPEIDLDAGMFRVEGMEYAFQVLGTESHNTLTWLWAWADEQTEVTDELLHASRQIRDWGAREGIREFTSPSIDLNAVDGTALSLISVGVSASSCYYRDAYEGGAAFLLLSDRAIDARPSFDSARLSRRYLDLLSRYDLDHRNTLLSYFRGKAFSPDESGSEITCELDSGETVHAVFEATGRLKLLNGEQV